MIALLDGDIIAYRSAASCEPTKARPEKEIKEVAILRADQIIEDTLKAVNADSYRVFLSGSTNFRKELYPAYKANRTTPVPSYLADVGAHLVLNHSATVSDGNEADDEMGITQYNPDNWILHPYASDTTCQSIICTIDKDLHQIPGHHYNFVTKEFKIVDERTGWFNFYRQLIFGDRSDNIPGYDGKMRNINAPPKFLEPIVQELAACKNTFEMWQIVKQLYEENSGAEIDPYLNAQLLYIQRKKDDRWVIPDGVS